MDKNPSEELRALEVELVKILCEVDIEISASESLINRENEFMIDKMIKNRVISNAIQKGFDQLRSAPAHKQTKLPSERIRELSRDPGVYTVDAIIKYLDQEFLDRLKPFVLRSEMENKVSVMQSIIEETEAKLGKCEKLLKDMEFAYTNKDEDFPHGFETETLKEFDLYFGRDPEERGNR